MALLGLATWVTFGGIPLTRGNGGSGATSVEGRGSRHDATSRHRISASGHRRLRAARMARARPGQRHQGRGRSGRSATYAQPAGGRLRCDFDAVDARRAPAGPHRRAALGRRALAGGRPGHTRSPECGGPGTARGGIAESCTDAGNGAGRSRTGRRDQQAGPDRSTPAEGRAGCGRLTLVRIGADGADRCTAEPTEAEFRSRRKSRIALISKGNLDRQTTHRQVGDGACA